MSSTLTECSHPGLWAPAGDL